MQVVGDPKNTNHSHRWLDEMLHIYHALLLARVVEPAQEGLGMEISSFSLKLAAQGVGADDLQHNQRRAPLARRRPTTDTDLVPREPGRLVEIHAR